MKYLTKSLLALFILLGAAFSSGAETLKLMTYNVRNGVGLDGKRNHKRTGAIIKAESPDFVAIQEVDSVTPRSDGAYVLADIAEVAGMIPIYAPAIELDGGRYGVGILVRSFPDSVTRVPLPGREEERMLVIADYKDYAIACTHFSLTPEDALASTDIIRQEAAKRPDRPMILMGDLNSQPYSPVIKALRNDFDILSDIDVYTFPADVPDECIDYIMISRCGVCSSSPAKVVEAKVASDHRPVVVEVDIDR
ncbi:MAG: metallophosphoesterase [Bacteroides sp.]|nr:metallophosphoesterase [Bacteroides sp.]